MSIFPISLAILLLYQKYTGQYSKSSSMIKKSSSYTLNTCQKLVTNLKENVNIFNDFSSEQRQPFWNNSTPFNSNIWRHQQTKHSWYCYLTLLPCFSSCYGATGRKLIPLQSILSNFRILIPTCTSPLQIFLYCCLSSLIWSTSTFLSTMWDLIHGNLCLSNLT